MQEQPKQRPPVANAPTSAESTTAGQAGPRLRPPSWSRVVLAALGLEATGGTVVVLGDRSRKLERAIRFLGGRLVRPAWTTTGSTHPRLAQPDGSVGAIFLEEGLDGHVDVTGGKVGPTQLLRQCHRVLAPGGRLVLRATNRRGLMGLAGRHASRRILTLRGYDRALSRAGFETVRYHAPWPHHDRVNTIICNVDGTQLSLSADTRLTRLMGRVLRTLPGRRLRLGTMPEYYLVARKQGVAAPTVLERVFGPEARAANIQLSFRAATHCICAWGDTTFFKVPLTALGVERLHTEVRVIEQLQRTPLAPYTLADTRFETAGRIAWAACPLVPPEARRRGCRERVEQAFDLLLRPSGFERLDTTATWKRVYSDASIARFERAGGVDVAERLASLAAHKRTAVGMIHGDLHADNMLCRDGQLVLIDWDHFEDPAPLVLDVFATAMRSIRGDRRSELPWIQYVHRLERLFDRTVSISHRERIESLLGELTWVEAVALYQLNGMSHHFEGLDHVGALDDMLERFQGRLEVCRDALR
jgi:SAM-dependent methyltransferase